VRGAGIDGRWRLVLQCPMQFIARCGMMAFPESMRLRGALRNKHDFHH
jgi:hypothetical protein